ncbi:MAG: hypothetical protein DKT66_24080 [Candidatus Melainabacteria bacterium]|nr:MAG: hypothetical protein DKT66_24080 [Candidatus Melainabacteria bacterium]
MCFPFGKLVLVHLLTVKSEHSNGLNSEAVLVIAVLVLLVCAGRWEIARDDGVKVGFNLSYRNAPIRQKCGKRYNLYFSLRYEVCKFGVLNKCRR